MVVGEDSTASINGHTPSRPFQLLRELAGHSGDVKEVAKEGVILQRIARTFHNPEFPISDRFVL